MMEPRLISLIVICVALCIKLFPFYYVILLVFTSLILFIIGFLSVIYLQHTSTDDFLKTTKESDNVLTTNISKDQSPDDQTPTTKRLVATDENPLETPAVKERISWKQPFENIKIYTDRKRSSITSAVEAEEVAPAHVVDSSPVVKNIPRKVLSGHKQIDYLLHTVIDYVLRDFIDSWFSLLSTNKEFSDLRTRHSIVESVANLCQRVKSKQSAWLPFISTTVVDHVATHTKLYRLARAAAQNPQEEKSERGSASKYSPLKRVNVAQSSSSSQHRRNKSDTDLNWHLAATKTYSSSSSSATSGNQKATANAARFNAKEINEERTLFDPEVKLIHAFFDNCNQFRDECLSEHKLERYLTNITEAILYFTLPAEDFACLPLRTFLATLLANVILKPILEMASDPDFVNLQIARMMAKDPPPAEYFIKMVRQCNDLSELRACRQLVKKQMEMKCDESTSVRQMSSLKYTLKLIDVQIRDLQSDRIDNYLERERSLRNLPMLTLDEILTKQLALSYYLDYLSILGLQKYVLFYLSAQEWKSNLTASLQEMVLNKSKDTREDVLAKARDRANDLYREYFQPGSANYLIIDNGLVEVLNIRLRDHMLPPDGTWFESISKYIYEKFKTEEIFHSKFYQSSWYSKLMLELGLEGHASDSLSDMDTLASGDVESGGSDSNSGDILFDDIDLASDNTEDHPAKRNQLSAGEDMMRLGCDLTALPFINSNHQLRLSGRHNRSLSDCTGIVSTFVDDSNGGTASSNNQAKPATQEHSKRVNVHVAEAPAIVIVKQEKRRNPLTEKLMARIINTAINSEGQYAVYAIEVTITDDGDLVKQWHVYRRYSKFLELKKFLQKRFPNLSNLPFPPKKAFQNTKRDVIEHRMMILNEFLSVICIQMRANSEMKAIIADFFEPDHYDKRMSGGLVTKTIENMVVNPLKSGMTKIWNMPDNLVSGLSRIFIGKGHDPMKSQSTFFTANPSDHMDNTEYPPLKSMIRLMDEVFDLQTRSQWLRRGIVNRVLGAPWVSNAANKKIVQAVKNMIEPDKGEMLLTNLLNTIWPDGQKTDVQVAREDNTKLRTRMAAKITLFALLSDDLRRIVGSETTRIGLLNFFSMWQNKTLNMRLLLVVLDDALRLLYNVDSLTKHRSPHCGGISKHTEATVRNW